MYIKLCTFFMFACIIGIRIAHCKAINENTKAKSGHALFLDWQFSRKNCPLCDTSVCGYCTDKLFHDSCCCNNPHNPYYPLPQQCQIADCSFLHANSCEEHKLITACCCIHYFCTLHKI